MAHSYFVCSLKIWPVLPFLIQGRANTRIIVEKSNYGGNKLSRGKSLPNFSISRSSANKNQGQDLFLSTTHGRVSYPRLIENPTFLDCWGYILFRISVTDSPNKLAFSPIFVIKFGNLFRQNTSIIIEELTLLSTSILFYANFGREVLGFLTSCHPLWSANLSCQFYLSFPNLRDRALREMKLVALEQELFQHKRNLPKIHLFSLSTKSAHK